jgi:DNA helicase-2/ATP-dependent DNA helicase PcrA
MHSADAQRYESGDIEMFAFGSDDGEGAYIAAEVKHLLGTPFPYDAKSSARGLAFSDFAVLVRVKALIPAITAALDAADIPYVVGGVASLFDTAEACAARMLFFYFAEDATAKDLVSAWRDLAVGIDDEELKAGITYARKTLADKRAGTERFGFYNLQRSFLGFLEHLHLREEKIAGTGEHGYTRGEVIYYNLGKFSQIISDFEQIYFQSDPERKYRSFADYLRYQAESIYPEGWLEARYVMPNAVQIMTIHQAKGLQWPVVFVPGLVRGRFPAKGAGGVQPWSVIPTRRQYVVGGNHRRSGRKPSRLSKRSGRRSGRQHGQR